METIEIQDKKIVFGEVRKIKDNVDETRTVTFVASNESKDRHNSVLNMSGWKIDSFNANPIVGYQHNVYGDDFCNPADPDDVVGKARVYIENKELLADVTFEGADNNPKAEKVFNKVKNGFLNAVSVGFIPVGEARIVEEKDKDGNVIDKTEFFDGQELLEISIVNIPSNRTALKKNFRDAVSRALHFIRRRLPEFSYSEIEQMKLVEIVDLVNGEKSAREYRSAIDTTEKIEKIQKEFEEGITADFDYKARMNNNFLILKKKKVDE